MAPTKPRRVLGYARVSSVEQAQGTSLADQQERIRREAAHRGAKDIHFYVEAEGGGYEKHEQREQIHALMREARAGDIVIVDKLDRWSRDPEVTYRSIRELREKGVGIYFVAEAIDPSTPNGELALSMWIGFARSEHRRIRDRMVGTREGLQAQGYYTLGGHPPYGYRRPPVDPKNRLASLTLVPEPEEAEIVRQVFKRYALGDISQRKLAEEFGLTIDYVNAMLSRRVYIGQVQEPPSAPGKNDGTWVKGKHEAIVDNALFDKVQKMIEQRTHGGPRPRTAKSETSTWILRDVATCARCGKKMRASYRGEKGRRAYYYLCSNKYLGTKSCRAPHVRIDEVEPLMRDGVKEVLSLLSKWLAEPSKQEPRAKPKLDAEAKRKTLSARRERFIESHAAGVIDLVRLKAEVAKIDEATARLEAEVAEAAKPSPLDDPKTRREMLRQVKEIRRAADALTPTEMRAVVNVFFSAVKLAKGEVPDVVMRSAEEGYARLGTLRDMLVDALGR